MNCPRCGNPIEGRALFCPQCGRKLDQEAPAPQPWLADAEPENGATADSAVPASEPQMDRARGCRSTLTIVGIALLVVLVVGGLAAAAILQGMRDRSGTQVELAQEHYQRGEAHLAEGNYELAIAEFEQALRLDPALVEAADRLAEAETLLAARPTPTSILQGAVEQSHWDALQAVLMQQDWAQVVQRAEQITTLDSTYRRQELDDILHDAYYQLGLQSVQENRMQEAVGYFDRALALRPGSAQASLAQSTAKLYMDGVRYAGTDWAAAVDRLSMLYTLDPAYRDVQARLHVAYLAYGQQLAAREDWCLAALQYRRANELTPADATAALAQEAADRCGAPPTAGDPTVPTGDDPGATPGATTGTPGAPAGTFVGRVDRTEHVAASGIYVRGQVLDREGEGVPNVRVKIQAWDWFAYATSDGSGQFSFDGLGNPVTYTLSLADLPSEPVDAPTEFTLLTWVIFEEAR
jgi:tetratricopeptide (TPR) repeat protein